MEKVVALSAPKPRSNLARNAAWFYAFVLTIMALGQLYGFEKFIPIISDYWLPGGHGTDTLVACLIVMAEVFALPFLLRMRLSPLMRWVGLASSVIVPAIWIKLSVFSFVQGAPLANGGIVGYAVDVPTMTIQLVLSFFLLALALYTAYGLWPNRKK